MEYDGPCVLPQAGDGPGIPLTPPPTLLGTTALRGPRHRTRPAPPAGRLLRPAHLTGEPRRARPAAAHPRAGLRADSLAALDGRRRALRSGIPRRPAGLSCPKRDPSATGPRGAGRRVRGTAGTGGPAVVGRPGLRRPVRVRPRPRPRAAALGPGRGRAGRPVADTGAGGPARRCGGRGRDRPGGSPRTPLRGPAGPLPGRARPAARQRRLRPGRDGPSAGPVGGRAQPSRRRRAHA